MNMVPRKQSTSLGFTLIEMIVSLGVFSVVVTTAVGAMLVLISTNQQLQAEQSVMTNLAFALDTMTREMRTGFNYYCHSESTDTSGGATNNIFNNSSNHESIVADQTADCANGAPSGHRVQGVSFYEGGDSLTGGGSDQRVLYFYNEDAKAIFRRVGNDDAQSIVSSGLVIQQARFYVSGSEPLISGAEFIQPTITLYIEAQEKNDPTAKTYYLNTTVTQRTLDL